MSNLVNQITASKNNPSSWVNVGIQKIKRARVDAFAGVTPRF
jgi:hypothetical protein